MGNSKKVMTMKGARLFDPRYGKFRKPGNNNPGLIFYDLCRRFELVKDSKELRDLTKKLANICDSPAVFYEGKK